MQPHSNDHVGQLFNGGANDVTESVARGPESLGCSHGVSQQIGAGYTFAVIVLMTFIFVRYFKWIGTKRRPPKKRKKK